MAEPNPTPAADDSAARLLPGFEVRRFETSGARIRGAVCGQGPPLLLLHGFPQSHVMWRRIAPALARSHTVVATDLRGYGDSSRPESDARHEAYSKRSMARDQVEVMQSLGFERFAVVGHDRGARVAHRLALDHPERVTALAVLDIVPTHDLYAQVTREFATAYFHWFLLIQPAPFPEILLANSAEFVLRAIFAGLPEEAVPPQAFAEYLRHFRDPDALHAMCEDYRAAATIDLEHDEADRGRRLACPLLALWAEKGAMHQLYDVLARWRGRARDARGAALPGGHFLPEQCPTETLAALEPFLKDAADAAG